MKMKVSTGFLEYLGSKYSGLVTMAEIMEYYFSKRKKWDKEQAKLCMELELCIFKQYPECILVDIEEIQIR